MCAAQVSSFIDKEIPPIENNDLVNVTAYTTCAHVYLSESKHLKEITLQQEVTNLCLLVVIKHINYVYI